MSDSTARVMKAKRGDLVVITRPKGEDMDLTLTNDFHNTEVTIRAKSLPWRVTPSQQRRIDRALCGMSDCKCGTIRGPQYHEGRRLWLDWSYGQQGEAVLVVDYEECEPKPAASRS